MSNIKFEIEGPYFEDRKFAISIDRIDEDNIKLESKYILMDKIFCFF